MIGVTVTLDSQVRGLSTEQAVDEDLNDFDQYQQRFLKNWDPGSGGSVGVPLTPHERANLKTYLAYKLGLGPRDTSTEEKEDGEAARS